MRNQKIYPFSTTAKISVFPSLLKIKYNLLIQEACVRHSSMVFRWLLPLVCICIPVHPFVQERSHPFNQCASVCFSCIHYHWLCHLCRHLPIYPVSIVFYYKSFINQTKIYVISLYIRILSTLFIHIVFIHIYLFFKVLST